MKPSNLKSELFKVFLKIHSIEVSFDPFRNDARIRYIKRAFLSSIAWWRACEDAKDSDTDFRFILFEGCEGYKDKSFEELMIQYLGGWDEGEVPDTVLKDFENFIKGF